MKAYSWLGSSRGLRLPRSTGDSRYCALAGVYAALRPGSDTATTAQRLAGLFESKFGPVLRFLMPLVLLAARGVTRKERAWVSRQIVEDHGDIMSVRSAPGRGATLSLWLPLAD